MTRDEYIHALLPGVRESIVHFVGQEQERRARQILDAKSTQELALMHAKHIGNGKPSSPAAPVVTDQLVEKERQRGEAELLKLKQNHAERLALQAGERAADHWKFQHQREPQRKAEAAASLARDRAAFDQAAKQLRNFARNDANFGLCHQVLGEGNFSAHLIAEGIASGALQLSKITQAELDRYRTEDVQAANQRLRDMSPLELRAELKRTEADNRASASQRETNDLLEEMRLRDLQLNLPPLPSHLNGKELNAEFLKKLCNTDLPAYKHLLRRFGGYALTLRLQGRG